MKETSVRRGTAKRLLALSAIGAVVIAGSAATGVAHADTPYSGRVASIQGSTLKVNIRGTVETIQLTPQTVYFVPAAISVSSIHVGDVVGATLMFSSTTTLASMAVADLQTKTVVTVTSRPTNFGNFGSGNRNRTRTRPFPTPPAGSRTRQFNFNAFRGWIATVTSISSNSVTLKTLSGKSATYKFAPKMLVSKLTHSSQSTLKTGTSIMVVVHFNGNKASAQEVVSSSGTDIVGIPAST